MPYPLEGFYSRASQQIPQPQQQVYPDFNQLNRDSFKLAIPNIPTMDNHSLAVLIKNNIDIISNDILQEDPVYATLFRDPNFISAFIKAVNSVPMNYTTRIACNKITYDYFTSDNPDPVIKQQYLNMSRVVNRDIINRLINIGRDNPGMQIPDRLLLDETTACNLALSRYSSGNEKTNVKRLNFTIYHKDPEVMNEQMVVWIYEKLFTRVSDLFQAIMFEVYTSQQHDDFGESFTEIYGTVGLAILTIVNNMPPDKIQKVLMNYYEHWQYLGYPQVRFSLRALSDDYGKINDVNRYLTTKGIYIP